MLHGFQVAGEEARAFESVRTRGGAKHRSRVALELLTDAYQDRHKNLPECLQITLRTRGNAAKSVAKQPGIGAGNALNQQAAAVTFGLALFPRLVVTFVTLLLVVLVVISAGAGQCG